MTEETSNLSDTHVLEIIGMSTKFADQEANYRNEVMDKIHAGKIPLTSIGDIPLKYLDVTKLPGVPEQNILTPSKVYKPFRYDFGYQAWEQQSKVFWLSLNVPMGDDMRDWRTRLSDVERSLLSNVFPLFVQTDMLVEDIWMHEYNKIFKPQEIQMAIASISNSESIHKVAYSHLLDSLAFPVNHYSKFMEQKAMMDKYNFTTGFHMDSLAGIALSIMIFGCMTEGIQLFSTFALMMNFPRQNKMKGMGQIISWSVRDESLHCGFANELLKVLIREFGHLIDLPRIIKRAIEAVHKIVANERAYIDLAFELGEIPGLTKDNHIKYVHHLADKRLKLYSIPVQFGEEDTPYEWLDSLLGGLEMANFFEQHSSEYSLGALKGDFSTAWDELGPIVLKQRELTLSDAG